MKLGARSVLKKKVIKNIITNFQNAVIGAVTAPTVNHTVLDLHLFPYGKKS